ncbi:rod-binding protein [Campylobacter sp. RM12640]|nr:MULTISPECIES: rod-binding protein [unclassified Campylobacter]MBZ7976176.1 rod-binding protein [Campylobacter sp. RM12637]MBZ7977606.1 rod-binding protein [Campylobacter sp. RM12654]MBZ7979246.1 rod-binding protein [Campylobacter sp. RM12642]MBZ7981247.1 rod-binding protein [Campylobacter sp. RM12640]MBZ7983380.1 rod-binding protein [Campylobacter sp. RM12647]MBZ7988973.1 rod-binding protein [Campylobacter sp. RM12635]MBZ7990837.1 rod-binding protein [Campylobacter sp. RM9331]MBZ7992619.
MDISKIYENTYKNTLPNTNTLIKLSEDSKNNFSNLLEKEINKIENKKSHEILNSNLINQPNTAKVDEKLLKEQTDAFEAFMIKSVLDISLKLENPLFGKDAGDDIYGSMYNDAMSKALSGGLGFSEMLFNFLKERL